MTADDTDFADELLFVRSLTISVLPVKSAVYCIWVKIYEVGYFRLARNFPRFFLTNSEAPSSVGNTCLETT